MRAIHNQVRALNLWWYEHLSAPEIAARLGVHRSTAWRYLKPLSRKGMGVKRSYSLHFELHKGWSARGYWY